MPATPSASRRCRIEERALQPDGLFEGGRDACADHRVGGLDGVELPPAVTPPSGCTPGCGAAGSIRWASAQPAKVWLGAVPPLGHQQHRNNVRVGTGVQRPAHQGVEVAGGRRQLRAIALRFGDGRFLEKNPGSSRCRPRQRSSGHRRTPAWTAAMAGSHRLPPEGNKGIAELENPAPGSAAARHPGGCRPAPDKRIRTRRRRPSPRRSCFQLFGKPMRFRLECQVGAQQFPRRAVLERKAEQVL